jgi:hypothetical protein
VRKLWGGTAKSGCPTRSARPRPVFGIFHEVGGDWIAFIIPADAIGLSAISDPVVERLILPEVIPGSTEYLVGFARSGAFEPVCNSREGDKRLKENVNVVGHDDKRLERVLAQFAFAPVESRHDAASDAWLVQPVWPGVSPVQRPVNLEKGFAT